ncbi:MAG: FtsX-like permease family protein, partial [Bacilli bacterium]|nr:FtsX-like permease family protein [Bacilli bacterium]
YLISDNLYSEEVEEYIYNHQNITNIEKEYNLWETFQARFKENEITLTYTINNADHKRELSKWKLVGASKPLEDMLIYLPISHQIIYNLQVDDEFTLLIEDLAFNFIIAGFTEDIFTTTTETGLVGLYVNNNTFKLLEESIGDDAKVIKIFANLKENNKDVEIGIKEITGAETLASATELTKGMFGFDLSIIKSSRIMMATMVSLIFVAFSALIVISCLLVVRFRINNSIEDDMIKIGTLKALGYVSKQIILSIVIQFFLISALSSLIGISLSYLTIPHLSKMFASQSALIWEQGFDFGINLFTFLFTNGFVILVALFTSRRIHKLHPITALRGGIVNHNFRKNYFPLEKSRLSLSINLSLKSIFNNLKQSFMIMIIALAIAFAGSFAVIMYYNTNVDITTFKETPGVEISNIMVYLDVNQDNENLVQELSKLEGIRKLQFIDTTMVFIDEIEISLDVMEDYSKKETNTVYKGRYPLHHNEIAINGYLAEVIDKEIGDSLEVSLKGLKEKYIITGFTQGASMLGMNGFMRLDGFKKLNPAFKQVSLGIYLNNGYNTAEYVEGLQSLYGDQVLAFVDIDKSMEEGTKSYTGIVSNVGIAILIVTSLIIILVLYLVINSSIIRNKKFIGIQKSIGFTTFKLMNQISLIFIVPTILGVIIGAVLGMELTNPMLSIVQKSMGIMKASYIIKPSYIAFFGIIIIIISYLTSLMVTNKIRKISAYSLMTE